MSSRVVLYSEKSPAAALVAALPDDFEGRAMAEGVPLPLAADETGVLLVDVDSDSPELVASPGIRAHDVPVIALAATPPLEAALPSAWYACLRKPVTRPVLERVLAQALDHARLRRESEDTRRQLEELNEIGIRLSAERDVETLLRLILSRAREITHSDAGSIYLVEEPEGAPRRLRFEISQNDSASVPLGGPGPARPAAAHVPISDESIAGHVALTGEIVHLDDAYVPPPGARYHINTGFDKHAGYRTKSMLVVPMKTPSDEVIGVLQLINCKRDPARRFASPEEIEAEALPYPERFKSLAASLASQAAVALQNSRHYESVRALFEGFVSASVSAIEARDPTTSGHSFRVADLTVALAEAADRVSTGPFRSVRFTLDQIREIRYASLLHDFGKVGVREEVLVKAKKLAPLGLELIRQRSEILKRGLELKFLRGKLDSLRGGSGDGFEARADEWDAELAALLAEIDTHMKAVAAANEPTVMPAQTAADLRSIAGRAFVDHLGDRLTVITPAEAEILSIPRGSLTRDEFKQIQSHVLYTYEFLKRIPWTKELRDVPTIARSHHEKLDGSGYPEGWRGAEIPMQSRMMTVSDIFDALTASDRPYKAAVPVDRALDILGQERKAGAIDADILDLFVELKPWEARRGKLGPDSRSAR
jgi:HD-GYP domain-containing protein (c-di-GMP phosphodiesterase class II)